MDTEDRRYFKQQEITLWRKADKGRKSAMGSSANPNIPSHLVGSDGEIMSKQPSSTNSISSNTQSHANAIGDNRLDDNKNSEEKTVGLFQEESPVQGKQKAKRLQKPRQNTILTK